MKILVTTPENEHNKISMKIRKNFDKKFTKNILKLATLTKTKSHQFFV